MYLYVYIDIYLLYIYVHTGVVVSVVLVQDPVYWRLGPLVFGWCRA